MTAKTPLILKHPINVDGFEVTDLNIRRPKLKDLKGLSLDELENMSAEAIIQLIGTLAEIPPSSAEQVDVADIGTIGDMISSFFPKPKKEKTGEESSETSPSDTASD